MYTYMYHLVSLTTSSAGEIRLSSKSKKAGWQGASGRVVTWFGKGYSLPEDPVGGLSI